jgi:aminoglycoside 6'-N-acetyltransferase I
VLRIRHAAPADADGWLALRTALWPEQDPASHAAEIARFLAAPQPGSGSMPEAVLLAAEGGPGSALAGFAEVSRRAYAEGCESSPVGFLEGWYVVPEWRRRGIGRALVEAAQSWARALGCTELASDAVAENQVSADAHRALGFEEVGVIRCFRKSLLPVPTGAGDPPPPIDRSRPI